jgi:putative two-component system response regulator
MQTCLTPKSIESPAPPRTSAGHDNSIPLPQRHRVLMVDDEELNILMVGAYLTTAGFDELLHSTDPVRAIGLICRERPDLVLLDIHMPKMSGLDVLRQIRSEDSLRHMPVVILTSETNSVVKMEALNEGATDLLQKPVHGGELLARLQNILFAKAHQDYLRNKSEVLETLVRQRTAQLEASRRAVIHCLARASEYRDDDTGHHVVRVGRYVRLVGEELGLDPCTLDDLELAAQLHDVGKIGIPDDILMKPGKLSPDEFNVMQRHCGIGSNIIQPLSDIEVAMLNDDANYGADVLNSNEPSLLELAKTIALTHHERWDGTGYPLGLMGEDIPLPGRITAVADVFDVLSSSRPYKAPYPIDKCFEIMSEGRGTHFDPRVLDAFVARREDVIKIQIEFANEE